MKAKPEAPAGFAKRFRGAFNRKKSAGEPLAPPQKSKRLRWILLILGILTAAFLIFQYRVVDIQLRPIIEKQLADAVHSPVSIGSVRAGLTGNVILNHVSLIMPGSPWESRVAVDQISVHVDLISLLLHRKALENCFESLAFVRPQITLVKNEKAAPVSLSNTGSSPASLVAPIPVFPVPKISIRDGSFSIQAEITPHEVLHSLNFDASTDNGTTWGISLLAHSPETKNQGTIQFDGSLRLEDLKVRGVVKLSQWPLASAGSTLKDTTGWELSSGTINMESPLVFQPGHALWFDGKADLNQAVLRSPNPMDITFSQISGRALLRPNEISVPSGIKFLVGETPWNASGFIPLDGRTLSVRAATDQLFLSSVFEDILKLKDMKAGGKGSAAFSVGGTFSNPLIDGQAELGPSSVGNWQLDSLKIKAGYANGSFLLKEVEGKLYEGTLSGNGVVALTGQPDAPVSLNVSLKDVETEKVASTLGLSGYAGKINREFRISGPQSNPVISSSGQMEVDRKMRNTLFHYSVRDNVQLKDKRLQISATVNEKSRIEGLFIDAGDHWDLEKFSLSAGKKVVKLTGVGVWPKTPDKPIQVEAAGKNISLADLPFFNDQFQDITGQVDVNVKVGGTRTDMVGTANLHSGAVSVKGQEPQPMDVSLTWNPNELIFDKLEIGTIFSTSGKIGFSPDSPLDLKMKADEFPIQIIAEIAGWNNPPQPFEGSVTGSLHLTGSKRNPILEGDDILVDSLKVGDWQAEKVSASLNMVDGKLHIKNLKLDQNAGSLAATGSWDTRSHPGLMTLRLSAHEFQLGHGPYLTGDFLWEARTEGSLSENWAGNFSSATFIIRDLKNKMYQFNDLSAAADCDQGIYKGKLKLGPSISGSVLLDASADKLMIQALLKIAPSKVELLTELTQFLPPSLKVTGNISGEIELKKGTFDDLPLAGRFVLTRGTIPNYDFDRLDLQIDGNKSKIDVSGSLTRDQAKYTLAGSLGPSRAFWDADSTIDVNGPIEGEKLKNILALLKIDTEKHHVSGEVNGNLSFTGPLSDPVAGFSINGKNLRYDGNIIPSAELHYSANFSPTGLKMSLEQNKITFLKGVVNIEKGSALFDPADPTLAVVDLLGSTKDLPIGPINFTSQIHLSGKLSLEEKLNRPTFDGLLSILENSETTKKSVPFDLAMSVDHKIIDFKPIDNSNPQLVGQLDLSQDRKISVHELHLVNTTGSFSADGTVDFDGPCQLVSDAKDVPIQEIGRWIMPSFPLSGTGNYHLVLNGTLEDPLFTTSISVADGKIGDLNFDLLDGELRSKNNTLYFGDEANPLTLSRSGLFTFTVGGKMPFALTKAAWLKVQNQDMDITAKMDKGDFGLILLGGLAKKASGEMDFNAHVGGTLDNPDLTLDLGLNNCQMVPSLVAQSIENISGRIKVRHNMLAVEDLTGQIGQGKVFISSPPIDQSKMKLVNFIPQYLDFRVQTVGDHGLWLSIPTLMHKGEWGEIYFYGDSPSDPMLIQGSLDEPNVIGTAKLDTGHYTFPPEEAVDEHGQKIEYRELAGVTFKLRLTSGKNTWYSNEFNTQYLELKVDPNCEIHIEGKDKDRTPDEAGIKCYGTASSKEGFLRYLGHEFKLEEGSINISKGIPPMMAGSATDRLKDATVLTAAGPRQMDVDVTLLFKGTFGHIDFNLNSSPQFSTDPDAHKKILYSYIMFGQDMTGLSNGSPTNYTPEELKTLYSQRVGPAVGQAADDTINRLFSNFATTQVRPLVSKLLGPVEVNIKTKMNVFGPGVNATPGVPAGPESSANPVSGTTNEVVDVAIKRYVDNKLSVNGSFGINNNSLTGQTGVQGKVGLGYDIGDHLSLDISGGKNESDQDDYRVTIGKVWALPNIANPKVGDKIKPQFRRVDYYVLLPGKYQLNWETDKYTKCELKVLDPDGNQVKKMTDNFNYYHQLTIDGLSLDPDVVYKVHLLATDTSGNQAETIKEISGSNK